MFHRLANRTIWRYPPETLDATLLRHGRRALSIAGVLMTSAALLFTSLLEFLLTEPGWWRDLWACVLIAALVVAMLLMLPGVVAVLWVHEVARECRSRGLIGPDA